MIFMNLTQKIVTEYITKELGNQNIEAIFFIKPSRKNMGKDLHIVTIMNNLSHTIYRHVLPAFSPVSRRLEIGCFPKNYFENLIANGYINMWSVAEIEKLREVDVLCQKNEIISRLKHKLENITVGNTFMGSLLKNLKISIETSKKYIENGEGDAAVEILRKTATGVLCVLIFTKYRIGISKYMHIYEKAKKYLGYDMIKKYESIQEIHVLNKQFSSEIVSGCIRFITSVLDRLDIKQRPLFENIKPIGYENV